MACKKAKIFPNARKLFWRSRFDQKNKLDAFVTVIGYPSEAIEFMIQRQDLHLVPIFGEGRDRLIKGSPFYSASIIPQNA